MSWRNLRSVTLLAACALLLSSTFVAGSPARRTPTVVPPPSLKKIPIYPSRQLESDLEVTGMLAALPPGGVGFVRHADLASLPTVTTAIHGDENFSEIPSNASLQVTAVPLATVAEALGAFRDSDLIDATCIDNYRAHFPAPYIARHHPLLALSINHLPPAVWAERTHQQDLGPYFVTHTSFAPGPGILSHAEQPQVPSNVVRLNFSSTTATFGSIQPHGSFPAQSPEQMGFAIARQSCLRCHNQGQYGGTKAGRSWSVLSTWAREQPAYFSSYIHNPKTFEAHAKMPANPGYDAATLAALTAYFRTFTEQRGTQPPAQN